MSSSGHVLLLGILIERLYGMALDTDLLDRLLDSSHLLTVFVLFLFFFNDLARYACNVRRVWRLALSTILFVGVADCITAGWYLFFKKVGTPWLPLPVGFLCTALILFSTYWASSYSTKKISGMAAAGVLGMAQGIALLPGISRLATVYAVACWLGMRPNRAFTLAWALAVPLMGAAGLVAMGNTDVRMLLIKMLCSPLCAVVLVVATGMSFALIYGCSLLVQRNRVWVFGWYMIFAAVLAAMI